MLTTKSHPCYECGTDAARIHLPVAAKCNIQCNYCLRKYDCTNESRPGVVSKVLSPEEAADRYLLAKIRVPNLTVAGIAGPGDALANFEAVADTFERVRAVDKDVMFCLSTNGLMLPQYVSELAKLNVSHLTVTLNAISPTIGSQIYKWVDYNGELHFNTSAAELLLNNQLEGIRKAVEMGLLVKINVVALKGINLDEIPSVAKKVSELGVTLFNVMPHIAVDGTPFSGIPTISKRELDSIRDECSKYVKQMRHCRQCRADAVGTLDNDRSIEFRSPPVYKRFAVASSDGRIVDKHFGHADTFYIFESDGNTFKYVDSRNVNQYCSGDEDCDEPGRGEVFNMLSDCDGVLAMRIGLAPMQKLQTAGKQVFTTYEYTEAAVISAAKEMIGD